MSLRPEGLAVRLLASVPNFEAAYFGVEVTEDKPYNALETLARNGDKFVIVEQLLDSLIDHASLLPDRCLEWNDINKLEEHLYSVIGKN